MIDPQTLSELWDAYAGRLVLYARALDVEAEDVVQEAFVRLAMQDRLPESPMAWLIRVVRNEVYDKRRRRSVAQRHAEGVARSAAWFVPSDAERCIETAELQRTLESIPADLRECVVMHVWGGLSFDEIASILQTSTSTAHRRYREALQVLKSRLGGKC